MSPLSKRGHVRALQIKTPAHSHGGELWPVRNLLLVPHFAFPPSANCGLRWHDTAFPDATCSVKSLKELSVKERGWALDALNIVAAVCDRRSLQTANIVAHRAPLQIKMKQETYFDLRRIPADAHELKLCGYKVGLALRASRGAIGTSCPTNKPSSFHLLKSGQNSRRSNRSKNFPSKNAAGRWML